MRISQEFTTPVWMSSAVLPREVEGCDECNRSKVWPVFTVTMNAVEVCAKCLTPMHLPRKRRPA